MATTPAAFFAERQGAAIIKHGVVGRYLRYFANKTGSRSPDHRVAYVDGYAGPGVYDDGNPGSPQLAADVAALVEGIRDLECYFVEKDDDQYAALAEHIGPQLPTAVVRHGVMEDHIDDILKRFQGLPMLALIDPFGLGLSDESVRKLAGRVEPTDLIVNVSLSAVRRHAGHLTSPKDYPAKQAFINKLDAALGGTWWQEIWTTGDDDAADQICSEYCSRSAGLRGAAIWERVRDRWEGPTAFFLLLITGHRDGMWGFNEFMSHAHEALRAADPRGLTDAELLLPYEPQWVDSIERSLRAAIKQRPTGFELASAIDDVYGDTLGFAREKHVRAALKRLFDDGSITASPKGVKALKDFRIKPT